MNFNPIHITLGVKEIFSTFPLKGHPYLAVELLKCPGSGGGGGLLRLLLLLLVDIRLSGLGPHAPFFQPLWKKSKIVMIFFLIVYLYENSSHFLG